MVETKTQNLIAGNFFSAPVFLEQNEGSNAKFVLTAIEMSMTAEIIEALKEWRWDSVFSNGKQQDYYSGTQHISGDNQVIMQNDYQKIQDSIIFYHALIDYITELFAKATMSKKIDMNNLADKIKSVCDFIKDNRRFILQAQNDGEAADEKNFLASHSARVTIFAIILGNFFKYPTHKLIELGISAITHEIGMSRLPPRSYMGTGALNEVSKDAINKHPVLGYEILRNNDFPLTICVTALEHHERENGSGYPRNLTSEKIGLNSKIIAVCCSFEAITAKRPFKDARDGYEGMMDLLRNEGKQYDDSVIRALVFSLSIFPIGLFVLLSNGKKAQVMDSNPDDPRFPIVQIFGEQSTDGKNKIIKTNANGIRISRPLRKDEIPATDLPTVQVHL